MDKVSLPNMRRKLAVDAVFEITSLSEIARSLVDSQQLDGLGRAVCGMLVRIEQLAEATMFCLDDDPQKNWGRSDKDLSVIIGGRPPTSLSAAQAMSEAGPTR